MTAEERRQRLLEALTASVSASPDNLQRLAEKLESTPDTIKDDLAALGALVKPKAAYDRSAPRSRKFTPETRARIIEDIRAGAMKTTAARNAGISLSSFKEWLRRTDPDYVEFQREVDEAYAEARAEKEKLVYHVDPAFWLKHCARDNGPDDPGWTETHKVEVKHEAGFNPSKLDLPADVLRVVLDAIRKASSKPPEPLPAGAPPVVA